jgi:hypothetical protein
MSGYVVYFTRSGNSKRIAESIAKNTGYELVTLSDNMDWNGLLGYLKAGYYTMKDKQIAIRTSIEVPADSKVVVVTPLWAGGAAQAARQFLATRPVNKTCLILSSNASVAAKLPNRENYLFVGDIVKKLGNEEQIVSAISKRLVD